MSLECTFEEIFDRHYFSNHHLEAQSLEDYFERTFHGFECVILSSFPALCTAIVDELCTPGNVLYMFRGYDDSAEVSSIEKFFLCTGRQQVSVWKGGMPSEYLELVEPILDAGSLEVRAMLVSGEAMRGLVLGLKRGSPILFSVGIFLTAHGVFAEKLRWARSSYGRRALASVNIASNCRLSEFQAYLIKNRLEIDK